MQVISCGKYLVTKAVIGQIMKMYFGGGSRERVEGVQNTPTPPSSPELLVYLYLPLVWNQMILHQQEGILLRSLKYSKLFEPLGFKITLL